VSVFALDLRILLGVDRGEDAHGQFLGVAQVDDFQALVLVNCFVHDELLQVEVEYRFAHGSCALGAFKVAELAGGVDGVVNMPRVFGLAECGGFIV